ncbi:MAG TPA: WbuC family cupin fold metalloprotein [Alphaproteobacteria bacterium]|nr:WbuC family cupin fold metalloprotein [Alphaproteobacteria bacterium]
MNLRRINDEVFIAAEPIVRLGSDEVVFIKRQAERSARKRARICAHKSIDDTLHEMIIAMAASSYIHPHRHVGTSESFHIIEGQVDVVMFDESGAVVDVIELGDARSGRRFYYRLDTSMFHTLLIRTDFLVVHEITNGPFDRGRTILAPFAPPESDHLAVRRYMNGVSGAVARHLEQNGRVG